VGAVKFLWKRKHLKKKAGSGSELGSIWLFAEPEAEAFFIKHEAGMWKRKRWKRLNFCGSGRTLKKEAGSKQTRKRLRLKKEAGSKTRKQTRKRLTLYGAGSGNKKYSTASTSLFASNLLNQPTITALLRLWWIIGKVTQMS